MMIKIEYYLDLKLNLECFALLQGSLHSVVLALFLVYGTVFHFVFPSFPYQFSPSLSQQFLLYRSYLPRSSFWWMEF